MFNVLTFHMSSWSIRLFCFRLKSHNKRPHRVDVTKLPPQSEGADTNGPTPVKAARMGGVHDPHDPNSSDHVVAVTQLKEKIAHLQKQISIKDGQLLAKDRQVSILRKGKFLKCYQLILIQWELLLFADYRTKS